MKHKQFKFIFTFVLCSCMLLSFTIPIYAATYNLNAPEPQVTDTNGYVAILIKHKTTGAKAVHLYQWCNLNRNGDNVSDSVPYVNLYLYDGHVDLTFVNDGSQGFATVWEYTGGKVTINLSSTYTSTKDFSSSYSSYDIIGFHFAGNVGIVKNYLTTNESFVVNYDGSNDISDLITLITSQNSTISTISGNVVDIENYLKTISSDIKTSNNLLTNIFNTVKDGFSNIINFLTGDNRTESSVDNNNQNNQQLDQNVNDYNDIKDNFDENMNTSIDSIDKEINLFNGSDFLNTATFISTNVDRLVRSNEYYESFVICGLVLGIALFLIGKKVI